MTHDSITYDIFAGDPAADLSAPNEEPAPSPARTSLRPLAIGAAVACIVGVSLGAWARPVPPPAKAPAAPTREATERVTILLDAGDHPSAPLAVLPERAGPPVADSASPPTAGCDAYGALAQRMVCVDPELAAADRRLEAAFAEARATAADPATLGRDQARWLATREQAALVSPEALAEAYARRLAELQTPPAAS